MIHNKRKKKVTDEDLDAKQGQVIDLASTLKQSQMEHKIFVCSECNQPLVHDATYRRQHPHSGDTYYCPNIKGQCSQALKPIDSSLVKLKVQPKQTEGAIPGHNNNNQQPEFIIDFIPEPPAKGLGLEQDPYDKYDPEPGEDERLKMEGWHIINSHIELTDSTDRNRTIVKHNQG